MEVRGILFGGRFAAPHALPFPVPVGGGESINVLWCEGPMGDVDDEGLLVIETNGADGEGSGEIHVFLDRMMAGCR